MKLVQANTWRGKLRHQLTGYLRGANADFICMQEVIDLPGSSDSIFAPMHELVEASTLPHAFHSPCYSYTFMHRTAHYGNAILSRNEPISTKSIFTSGSYIDDFDTQEHSTNIRNFQHAEFEMDGRKLHILNHHGYFIREYKEGNDLTEAAMGTLAEYIKVLDGAVIVTGDFNLSPGSDSLRPINKALHNLSVESGLETTYTQFGKQQAVCDYIFVNGQIKVTGFSASDEVISDHKALVLEFDL